MIRNHIISSCPCVAAALISKFLHTWNILFSDQERDLGDSSMALLVLWIQPARQEQARRDLHTQKPIPKSEPWFLFQLQFQ